MARLLQYTPCIFARACCWSVSLKQTKPYLRDRLAIALVVRKKGVLAQKEESGNY